MQALITGGAGFIGSHLAEALLERGDEVFVIDDLSTGSITNLDHVRKNPRLHVTIDKVENTAVLAELVDRADIVYHLAAAVGVKSGRAVTLVRTIETNLKTTEVVLEYAAKKGKRVFFASTSEVYGKRDVQPCGEDDDLIIGPTNRGRWSYACSKAIDQFLAPSPMRASEVGCQWSSRVSSTPSAHDRPAAHGMVVPSLRPPGAGKRADHRVRRRHPGSVLRVRRRRGKRRRQAR